MTYFESLESRELMSATLYVDDDRAYAAAKYRTIQSAINAARPGDTIRVMPGTYREALDVPKGKDSLTIISDKARAAVIDPPDTSHDAVSLAARGTTFSGFTVVGVGLTYGVYMNTNGASATITQNRIKSVRDAVLSGVQRGIAVGVLKGDAVISNNTIDDYQKAGIFVDGHAASAKITANTVAGAGPTGAIAQVGIQVSRGANALISANVVGNNRYTGQATATGIDLYRAGDVSVLANKVSFNDENMVVEETAEAVLAGNISTDATYDGIALFGATKTIINVNRLERNAYDGILIDENSRATKLNANASRSNGNLDVENLST